MTSETLIGPYTEERLFQIAMWLQMRLAAEGMRSIWASAGFVSRTSLEQKWKPEEVSIDGMVPWIQGIVEAEEASLGQFDLHFEIRPEGTLIHFDHHGCLRVQGSSAKRVEMISAAGRKTLDLHSPI